MEKEDGRQFENEESDKSPYFSEEDLSHSYIRQYESGSNHHECAPRLPLTCECIK